jgi:transposase
VAHRSPRANMLAELPKGAPQAQQVADRWHLLKNLREALERVLGRVHASLKQQQETAASTPFPRRKREQSQNEQVASQLSRQHRKARYEEVIDLYRQGVPLLRIAQQLQLSRGTIYKYVAASTFPERAARSASAATRNIIDPYSKYLRPRSSFEKCKHKAMQAVTKRLRAGYKHKDCCRAVTPSMRWTRISL